MGIKDDVEIEWTDALIDAVCDKLEELLDDSQVDLSWTVERLNAYMPHLPNRPTVKSHLFYRGYNAGIADTKILLGMIKERQDG